MAETYEIVCEKESVGRAQVERQGLYLCFACRCRLPDEGFYRIHVTDGENREDLGICIPMEGAFGMDKRIPAKRLGAGGMTFELVPGDWKPREVAARPEPMPQAEEPVTAEPVKEAFIPVSEEEPFEHLDKLENASMELRDHVSGILIPEIPEQ